MSSRSKKSNLVIIEPDYAMFDLLKQDIKTYSPYVNHIYHYSQHEDMYSDKYWLNCKLILAHNSDDIGLGFFKNFYLKNEVKEIGIYGLIHTMGHENELQFYRVARYLYEWSDGLFLGVVYKRFGGLEKILELLRNLALNRQLYPIYDWLQNEKKKPTINASKLQNFRSVHSTKYNIVSILLPMINMLRQFNEEQKAVPLLNYIEKHDSYLHSLVKKRAQLKLEVERFLHLKLRGKALDSSRKRVTETSYYVKEIKKFLSFQAQQKNGLTEYLNLFCQITTNNKGVVTSLESKAKNGSIDLFLREYNSFTQALNKLANLLDEDCMFGK